MPRRSAPWIPRRLRRSGGCSKLFGDGEMAVGLFAPPKENEGLGPILLNIRQAGVEPGGLFERAEGGRGATRAREGDAEVVEHLVGSRLQSRGLLEPRNGFRWPPHLGECQPEIVQRLGIIR